MSGRDRTTSLISKDTFFNTSRKKGGGRGMDSMNTGYSSAINGNVTMDPSIRAIQDQAMARNAGLYGDLNTGGAEIMNNLRGTRSRFQGNQSAYIESKLNPMRQEYAQREGALQRNIGLRGLTGSSFGQQSLDSFSTEKNRGLGDARAQAEFENLSALTGIDAQMAQTMFGKVGQQMQLNGMDLDTAKARLAGELQALGVGQAQINTMVNAFESQQNRAFQERKAIADSIMQGFSMGGGGGGAG